MSRVPWHGTPQTGTDRGTVQGGHALLAEAPARKVEAEPQSGSDGVGEVRKGWGRRVCLRGIDTLPTVVLSRPTRWVRMHYRISGQTTFCMPSLRFSASTDTAQDR